MEFSTCPICFCSIPSLQLHRHANDHFANEDYARDFELPPDHIDSASHIAECTPSSWHNLPSISSDSNITSYGGRNIGERYDASLVCSWSKETFYRVEGGLMNLLRKCLESETGKPLSVLSGHVDHFQSIESWDVGWGCGWRNIQMLSSYLLSQQQEAREVLYGGSGFVPNIGSLQRWLELAWEKGFDATGSKDFNQKIYGKRNWIGTTECAAIFRSFGIRARIVDFSGEDFVLASQSHSEKRKRTQVYGPMDAFLSKGKLEVSLALSSVDGTQKHPSLSYEKGKKGHEILTEWVWNYFFGESVNRDNHGVILSEKPPLYFQHDGHSRTIVGIQAKYQSNGVRQYNLLVFDPAQRTRAMETSLRENSGWQKLIKRGGHTLKKAQYQLCFIDGGIAHGGELEELKTLHSIRYGF